MTLSALSVVQAHGAVNFINIAIVVEQGALMACVFPCQRVWQPCGAGAPDCHRQQDFETPTRPSCVGFDPNLLLGDPG